MFIQLQFAIFFIIDGVNECPPDSRQGILTFLKCLQGFPRIRILITAQPTPDIIAAILSSSRKELEKRDNADNIDGYINLQLAVT